MSLLHASSLWLALFRSPACTNQKVHIGGSGYPCFLSTRLFNCTSRVLTECQTGTRKISVRDQVHYDAARSLPGIRAASLESSPPRMGWFEIVGGRPSHRAQVFIWSSSLLSQTCRRLGIKELLATLRSCCGQARLGVVCRPVARRGAVTTRAAELKWEVAPEQSRDYAPVHTRMPRNQSVCQPLSQCVPPCNSGRLAAGSALLEGCCWGALPEWCADTWHLLSASCEDAHTSRFFDTDRHLTGVS